MLFKAVEHKFNDVEHKFTVREYKNNSGEKHLLCRRETFVGRIGMKSW